jgi:hypothetical protein
MHQIVLPHAALLERQPVAGSAVTLLIVPFKLSVKSFLLAIKEVRIKGQRAGCRLPLTTGSCAGF